MNDPRLTPANARVAATHLRGQVEEAQNSGGAARQLLVPVADFLDAPDGKRQRQVVSGESVTVYEDRDGWSFVQLGRDGYVGYLRSDQLTDAIEMTHWVSARMTHVYPQADLKSPELYALSHMSRVRVLGTDGRFARTSLGYVAQVHLTPLTALADDQVAVAELYLGTPYLWGGNSSFGIDCSGLVQVGLHACGLTCPGDSDLQMAELGAELDAKTNLQRGDLLFWGGHVAWVVDDSRLIHANAGFMAVAYESIEDAIARIAAQGDGPVISRKRLGGQS